MELLKLDKLEDKFWLNTTTPSNSLETDTSALTPWAGSFEEMKMVKSCEAPITENTVAPGSGLIEKTKAASFVFTVGFSEVDSLVHPDMKCVMQISKQAYNIYGIFFMC